MDPNGKMAWEAFRQSLDRHPGLVGKVGNGNDGFVWVFGGITDPNQVARPFFNITCGSPQAFWPPAMVSIEFADIDLLVGILRGVQQRGLKTVEEAQEAIYAAAEARGRS